MTPLHFLLRASGLLVTLVLSACGGGSNNPGIYSAAHLPAGSYQVSASGDDVGIGEAFFGAKDGFILLSRDGDAAASLLYAKSRDVRRIPDDGVARRLTFVRHSQLQTLPLVPSELSSTPYRVWLGGMSVGLSVSNQGRVQSTSVDCTLQGDIDFGRTYGHAVAVALDIGRCGALPVGHFTGLMYSAATLQPAAFRLVAENGRSFVDLLAYSSAR